MQFKVMKNMFLMMLITLTLSVSATEGKPDIKKILDNVDRLYRSEHSFATLEMRIETPDWKRTLDINVWASGIDKTFIRILSPQKDKGVATLRIQNDMWNFFPKIDKTMKVPPSMMMGSWMGSDFTNDDLVKESTFLKDYDSKLSEGSDKDNFYIDLRPKAQTATVWDKIILIVNKTTSIPVRQEYYDDKGTKIREIVFKDIKKFGNRNIPAVMELTPFNKAGHKTTIEYKELKFDKVEESIFSQINLQKRI
ncbi:MAG: outer membrane lipoprotein-sorting protein [Bacteriovorax sp.]|nr:outer membrane lipoprotein-sorting protein [Bacteriovorax sp.]